MTATADHQCAQCNHWLADAPSLKVKRRPEAVWGWCEVKRNKTLVNLPVIRGPHRSSEVGMMTRCNAWCDEFDPA